MKNTITTQVPARRAVMKRTSGVTFTLVLALCLSVLGCASQNTAMAPAASGLSMGRQDLSTLIQAEMKAKKIPGLAIVVANSKGTLWSAGFGVADKSSVRQFSPTTISNVGSVAKLFTGTAIMRLVDQGALDLDAPVSRYLPEFAPKARGYDLNAITVRSLLAHESGLASDAVFGFWSGEGRPGNYPDQLAEALPAVNELSLTRKPYTIFSYCNIGYSMLGLIVERVSGLSFNDYLTKEVFQPLGMLDSSFLIDDAKRDRYATGYSGAKESFVPYIRDMPAGSLCSTSDDMGRYLSAMLASYKADGGFLRKPTVRQAFSPQNDGAALDLDFKIGLTWWIVDLPLLPGEFMAGHGGDLPPYHALLGLLPDRDLGVFVMVNGCEGVGSFSLADILSAAAKQFAEEQGQGAFKEERLVGPKARPASLPTGLADRLVGYYASTPGIVQIKKSGTGLKAFAFGTWLDLVYRADGSFTFGASILGIPIKLPVFDEIFVTVEELEGSQMFNMRCKGVLLSPCIRIQPVAVPAQWLARTGTYAQINQEPKPMYQGFKLGMDKATGFFCFYTKAGGQWGAHPLRFGPDGEAFLMGEGRALGEAISWGQFDGEEILSFEGLRLRRK